MDRMVGTASSQLMSNGVFEEERRSRREEKVPAHPSAPRPSKGGEDEGLIEVLLSLDHQLTFWAGVCARPRKRWQRVVKMGCMCLEMSGHGLIWLVVCVGLLAVYALTWEETYWTYGVDLLSLLAADVLLVAPLKLIFRRSRPALNEGDIPMSVTWVDNYAFPSGHASRCVAVAMYFCYTPPFNLCTHLWYIWAVAVSLSRVLIGRHHISDVVAGTVAGLVVFEIVRRVWL